MKKNLQVEELRELAEKFPAVAANPEVQDILGLAPVKNDTSVVFATTKQADELLLEINEGFDAIDRLAEQATKIAIEVGNRLRGLRGSIPHGSWETWYEAARAAGRIRKGLRTAQRCMALSEFAGKDRKLGVSGMGLTEAYIAAGIVREPPERKALPAPSTTPAQAGSPAPAPAPKPVLQGYTDAAECLAANPDCAAAVKCHLMGKALNIVARAGDEWVTIITDPWLQGIQLWSQRMDKNPKFQSRKNRRVAIAALVELYPKDPTVLSVRSGSAVTHLKQDIIPLAAAMSRADCEWFCVAFGWEVGGNQDAGIPCQQPRIPVVEPPMNTGLQDPAEPGARTRNHMKVIFLQPRQAAE